MKVLFIVNPKAGGSNGVKMVTDGVRKVLKGEDGIFKVRETKDPSDASTLASEAVRRGYDAVFACGGDGTVNRAASQLVNTSAALGIIPLGSGNGFARALGIPTDVEACLEPLKKRKIKRVDAGLIAGRYFFSTAGIGFDAHLSKAYNEGSITRKIRGLAPYFPLSIIEFYRYKHRKVTIRIDNNVIRESPFLLTAANTERYGGDAVIAPGACPDDGLLDLCIVPETGLINAMGLAKKLLNGGISTVKEYRCIRASQIGVTVNGGGPVLAQADGEPFEHGGEFLITVEHKALQLLVN